MKTHATHIYVSRHMDNIEMAWDICLSQGIVHALDGLVNDLQTEYPDVEVRAWLVDINDMNFVIRVEFTEVEYIQVAVDNDRKYKFYLIEKCVDPLNKVRDEIFALDYIK